MSELYLYIGNLRSNSGRCLMYASCAAWLLLSVSFRRASSRTTDFMEPTNHEQFYFSDGNVVFEVEGTRFNLHRSILSAASPAFSDMFSLGAKVPASNAEAGTPNNIVVLDGMATLSEMQILCRVLYRGWMINHDNTTLSEVTDLMEVSRKWTFDTVYARAITLLSGFPLDPAVQIYYGRRFELDRNQWIIEPARELARTLRPLTAEHVERLGYAVAYKVLQSQEAVRAHRISRLQPVHAKHAGCCVSCAPEHLRPALSALILLLTQPLPEDESMYSQLEWIQGRLVATVPVIRSCMRIGCGEKWPSLPQVKNWLEWKNEGAKIDMIIKDI